CIPHLSFFPMRPPPPISTLFPYTTLFRSVRLQGLLESQVAHARLHGGRVVLRVDVQDPVHAVQGQAEPAADRDRPAADVGAAARSEEHTSELQSRENLVCRLLLEKKKLSP